MFAKSIDVSGNAGIVGVIMQLQYRTKRVIDHVATGNAARTCRERSGVSLRHVARVMQISAAYLSDLEHGRRNWSSERVGQFNEAARAKQSTKGR